MDSRERLGRYEILEEIGRGAMGVVYLAQDPLIGRRVALKVFRVGFSASDDELRNLYARFIREAQSAGILSHPNIVTVHDVAQAEGDVPAFIAMEYVEGPTLKDLLDSPEPIDRERALELVIQIASALEYAHSMGVVHRDVKPGNILVTPGGAVKITDFGIALVNSGNITNHGQLLGTPNYMAPEAIEELDVDHRADLFSLGVVLYELMTRHKPFDGKNQTKVTHRIVYEPFTPPEHYVEDLPPALVDILTRALEKQPEDRFQSAAEFSSAIVACLTEGSVGSDIPAVAVAPTPGVETSDSIRVATGPPPTVEETAPSVDTQSVKITPAPLPKGPSVWKRLTAGLHRTTPLGNVPVWLIMVGLFVGIGGGYLLSRSSTVEEPVSTPVSEVALVSPMRPMAVRVADLAASAEESLTAGSTENAYFSLLEATRIDPGNRSLRERLNRTETRMVEERQQWQGEVDENLGAAERSLADDRVRDAIEFSNRALRLDPMNLEAPELIARSEAVAASIRARRKATPDPVEVETVAVVEPEPEPVVVEVAKPEPTGPVATTGTLVLRLVTERSPGVLTLYLGDVQLMREKFRFVPEKKKGFLRSIKSKVVGKTMGGELSSSFELDPGELDMRVYLSLKGMATQVLPVRGEMVAGTSRTLTVDVQDNGNVSAELD